MVNLIIAAPFGGDNRFISGRVAASGLTGTEVSHRGRKRTEERQGNFDGITELPEFLGEGFALSGEKDLNGSPRPPGDGIVGGGKLQDGFGGNFAPRPEVAG
jgi:hypothetical protein